MSSGDKEELAFQSLCTRLKIAVRSPRMVGNVASPQGRRPWFERTLTMNDSVSGPGSMPTRVYLAAIIMPGILAASHAHGHLTIDTPEAARKALELADALLKASKA
jgi:hypothetical protein